MKLTQDQQETLTLVIQAVLCIVVIFASIRSNSKAQATAIKKLAKTAVKQASKKS